MKANRKAFNNDEEAVSPVIAVILMVAITVVLAATVFVLVNELGQDVGSTGPNIGLTTHSSATDTDKWTVTLTSTTRDVPISEYTFILTVDGESESSRWRTSAGDGTWYSAGENDDKPPNGGGGEVADNASYFEFDLDGTDVCYKFTHTDIAEDDRLAAGDRLVLSKVESDCDSVTGATAFDEDMSDRHELELLHRPTGSGSGSISRNF